MVAIGHRGGAMPDTTRMTQKQRAGVHTHARGHPGKACEYSNLFDCSKTIGQKKMTAQKKPGWLREAMPKVAGLIDEKRRLYGTEHVDACITAARRGEPDQFFAFEAGHVVGAPFTDKLLMDPVQVTFMAGGAAMVMRAPKGFDHGTN